MPHPHYSDSSCDGQKPTYLGSARGRRSFYLDENGVLRGVTYRAPWVDGENVAECMVTRQVDPMAPLRNTWCSSSMPPYTTSGVAFDADASKPPEVQQGYEWDRCDGLDPECGCGFYAYHSGDVYYATAGPGCRVQGIIEAYGRMVLGTKGYRAQKARIVAICAPPSNEISVRRRGVQATRDSVARSLTQLELLAALPAKADKHLAIMTVASAFLAALAPGLLRPAALAVCGFVGASLVVLRRARREGVEATRLSLERELEALDGTLRSMPNDYWDFVEKAKARYPSVEFFTDPAEMHLKYPTESLTELARQVSESND
jgi:hypothetical protein